MLGTFNNWMRILERTLQSQGKDLGAGLRLQGIDLAEISRLPRLPVSMTRRIWAAAEVISGDPVLGMSMLSHMDFADFGDMGVVLVAGGSLPQLLERIARFHALLTDALYYDLRQSAQRFELTIYTRGEPHWRAVEMTTGLVMRLLRTRLDPQLCPLSVDFAFANPAGQVVYERFYGCAVRQGAAETRVTFDLARSPVAPGGELGGQIDRILAAKLQQLEQNASWAEKVGRVVRTTLSEGEPTLADVGRVLHASTRTLQRHLATEGKSFQQVVDDARQTLARDWMATNARMDRPRPLTELAMLLGFSSSSAFSRAFRRWFDMTPGQAAKQQTSSGGYAT